VQVGPERAVARRRKVGDNSRSSSYPIAALVNSRVRRSWTRRRLPQLHLREVWPRRHRAARRTGVYQVFRQEGLHNLREEYGIREVTKAEET